MWLTTRWSKCLQAGPELKTTPHNKQRRPGGFPGEGSRKGTPREGQGLYGVTFATRRLFPTSDHPGNNQFMNLKKGIAPGLSLQFLSYLLQSSAATAEKPYRFMELANLIRTPCSSFEFGRLHCQGPERVNWSVYSLFRAKLANLAAKESVW